ncbi:GTP-binding protein [Oribacterium sp. WCC10]|uniref:GTP-binding protein n=1 Tax=Oribacterium sp. WCC10 TaxID=1855343 RepID=UPI0008E98662|nr:GTP-binding protein [Oribacterium sp. WCC10]SFG21607.1 GTPase, G3E family [Oribacterium sp. WCC10]
MKILLVSGFLGAGKTTFIKELIKKTETHPVIMENEYGDNNLDSLELKAETAQKDDIKVMEFMEGCVCCSMKDSFANSVFTIYSSLDPEYLVVEPTGVGKLSNIIRNLSPLLHSNISLLKPVVVLSPENFTNNMKEWPELYRDQIENASTVVFSKCEHTSADILQRVSEMIHDINPNADITGSHYSYMNAEWWNSLMDINESVDTGGDSQYINGLNSADASMLSWKRNGADSFSQVSITKTELDNPAELVMFLEDCLHGEFGHMARAKGTVLIEGEMLRFDLADRMYAITSSPDTKCQCVFIGQFLDERKIRKRFCGGRKVIQKIQQIPEKRFKTAVNDIW